MNHWWSFVTLYTRQCSRPSPRKRRCKKIKLLSEEALQIAEKREVKGKGEKERYKHLNAEFQRIATRDKKAFLSDQCKEIEENNTMGKTRDLLKKIRYQGNISCKDGHNKGQKWYEPKWAEEINKRWKEYTETTQKGSSWPTHLEPDILECEVKWALWSITTNKASGGDGIPVELFQILKDDAVKVVHLICQQIWKTQQWPQDWKRSVFIPIPKKGNAKGYSDYSTITLLSHASKVMLKIFQARFQQYMNHEFQMFKLDFEKAEEPEIILPTSVGSSIKQESSRKTSTCSLLTMPKLLTVWITANYGKFSKRCK